MKLSLILAGGLALAALLASAGAAAAQAQDGGPFRARRFTAETKVGDVVKADQREGGLVHDQTVFGPTAFDFDAMATVWPRAGPSPRPAARRTASGLKRPPASA
jgi:hypothetical protein